jgi:hypothetical protein
MVSFLQFLRESLAQESTPKTPREFPVGSSWYNSKTGQMTAIEGHSAYDVQTGKETPGANGLTDATYHAGFVVKNLHHFGISPEELHDSILQFENPSNSELQTPEGRQQLAERRVRQLKTGYIDTHRGVDSLLMGRGWVRVSKVTSSTGARGTGLYVQGKAPALYALARDVHRNHPDIESINMDVHGASETYGHLDSTIQAMAHRLQGRDTIQDFVERRGAPDTRSYTQIIRTQKPKPINEIYGPKTEPPPARHPDYEGIDDEGQHIYRAGVGRDGTVESIFSVGNIEYGGKKYPNAVEAEFSVNDSWKKNALNKNLDPHKVLRIVHSHFDHFIRTRNPSAIFYDTQDPVRHRIYQMASKRYGIPAINYTRMEDK